MFPVSTILMPKSGRPGFSLSGAMTPQGKPMIEEITLERVQELVTRAPYHKWLGLKVVAVDDGGIELKATWREEWVVNPDRLHSRRGARRAGRSRR
jgi:hypothetical protein